MKRYYICPKSAWHGTHKCGEPHHALMAGSSYIELDDQHILLLTDFTSEWAEAEWHSHPEVARLAHPTMEAGVPLSQLCDESYRHKQFTSKHLDLLSILGVTATDTVWDLHNKLKDDYPGLRLNSY
jgi:hypothetical protein